MTYDLHPDLRLPEPRRGRGRPLAGGTNLVGRHYLLHGRPVTVLIGWGPGTSLRLRNVAIRYDDTGETTVRPFRGLRRPTPRSSE